MQGLDNVQEGIQTQLKNNKKEDLQPENAQYEKQGDTRVLFI